MSHRVRGHRLARVTVSALLAAVLGTSGAVVIATAAGATVNTPGTETTFLYVDARGSGVACTQDAPCASITQAEQTVYGDELYNNGPITIDVGAGAYDEQAVFVSPSYTDAGFQPQITINGTPNQTIVYQVDDSVAAITNECASLTITGVTFTDSNTGVASLCGSLTLENDTFTALGTGVRVNDNDGPTTTSITDSSFYYGGTGADLEGDTATVSDSVISNFGNAIFTEGDEDYSFQGTLSVTNSTLTGSYVAIATDDADVSLQSSTLSGNQYGFYDEPSDYPSTFDYQGSILANNTIDNCYQVSYGNPEGAVDEGYNVVTDSTCGASPSNGSVVGVDPNLGALQDNGGYTWTQDILPTSVAYHLVPSAYCPATDQRGETRPNPSSSGFCDAGAYEYAPPTSLSFVTTPQTGETSNGGTLGAITVQAYDAEGLPAVSAHAIQLELSTSGDETFFSQTPLGADQSIVTIPSQSTETSFYFGSEQPGVFPLSVQGWNGISNLGVVTQDETVNVGPPSLMYLEAGNEQTAAVGTTYPTDLEVLVTDQFGNPISDSPVTFTVDAPGGEFNTDSTTATVNTNADGDATAPALVAPTSVADGYYEVSVTDGAAANVFGENMVVGPASIISVQSGSDQSVVSNQPFGSDLEVLVTDEYGNAIQGATVDFDVTSGSARFGGSTTTTAVTDGNGEATVTDLAAGAHGGPQTITATVAGSPLVTTSFTDVSITPLTVNATVSSFAIGKFTLSTALTSQIHALATSIAHYGDTSVTLDGYADDSGTTAANLKLSVQRASEVRLALLADLKAMHVTGVSISAVGKGATNFIGKPTAAANRRVTAVAS